MSSVRADTFTSTEDAAGRFDRASAYEVDDREHDEPGMPIERQHACAGPACRNLLCVLDRVVTEQKAGRR